MNINNPTTFAVPNLTLSTSNSSGTSGALRADDTILIYDTTGPTAVAASAVVGSAATSTRRDHVHVGVIPITSTDEAITRYSGTGGQLQNYSSLPPTISDAGILSLTSGALKFPATEIVSADANTMDDWQEGTWTPGLADASHDADEGSYSTQVGRYVKFGNLVYASGHIVMSALNTLSGGAYIEGLPFVSSNIANLWYSGMIGFGGDLNITSGETVGCRMYWNVDYINLTLWDTAAGTGDMQCSEVSDNGDMNFSIVYRV